MKGIVVLALLLHAIVGYADVVKISGEEFADATLYVDNDFGGFIGDTLALGQGKHRVSWKGPHEYQFTLILNVAEDVSLESASFIRFDECIKNRVSPFVLNEWPEPTVSTTNNISVIDLSAPVFENRGDLGECRSDPSLMTLTQLGSIKLTVSSEPSSAEIWVKGKRIGTSDTTVVVPFNNADRGKTIQVVLRKPGYANCLISVAVPEKGDIDKSVDCGLESS